MTDLAVARRGARFTLAGHSGAKLTLTEVEGGQSFVRKQARSTAQNTRLAAQCDKLQRAYAAGISCPLVLRSGQQDDLFWFDMEFIPADSLAHVLIAGHEPDWRSVLPQIAALPTMLRKGSVGAIPEAQFQDKLKSIVLACRGNDVVAPAQDRVLPLVARLLGCDWAGIPVSDCHGDFTLENILVRADGRVVLIDFDVPEQSSWLLDIAKLYQDLLGHWCLRHLILADPEGLEALNARLAISRAARRMDETFAPMIPGGLTRLRPVVAFHLLRTLPYARSPLVVDYVLQRIQAVLDE